MTGTRAPSLKTEQGRDAVSTKVNDEDEYSDPDEGVEIVDMENVRQMDWAAPESLQRDKNEGKKKKAIKIKKEDPAKAKGTEWYIYAYDNTQTVRYADTAALMDMEEAAETGEVDLANALDLSESEEEEELEDLIDDFALLAELDQVRCFLCLLIDSTNSLLRAGCRYPTRKAVFLSVSRPIPYFLFQRVIA